MDQGRSKQARKAYNEHDVESTKAVHQIPLTAEEKHSSANSYIKTIVFGGLDGILTTFAVVTAAAGASNHLSPTTVLIFGFANLLADGFAMGFGEYTSSSAEVEYAKQERQREEWEMENFAEGERSEMVELYKQKGLSEKDAILVIDTFMKYPKQFVDLMMVDELGIQPEDEDESGPLRSGIIMFIAFVIFGAVPLLAYVPRHTPISAFPLSCLLTILCLAVLGFLKTGLTFGFRPVGRIIKGGLQMLTNGIVAASVSYGVSYVISNLVMSSAPASVAIS